MVMVKEIRGTFSSEFWVGRFDLKDFYLEDVLGLMFFHPCVRLIYLLTFMQMRIRGGDEARQTFPLPMIIEFYEHSLYHMNA